MKLLQRMLSHGLLIAIVVVAGLAYWYRAELFPDQFGPVQPRTVAGKPVVESGHGHEDDAATAAPAATPETQDTTRDDAAAGSGMAASAPDADLPPMRKEVPESPAGTAEAAPEPVTPVSGAGMGNEPGTAPEPVAEPQFRPLESEREAEEAAMPETVARIEVPEPPQAETGPADTTASQPVATDGKGYERRMDAAREAFWRKDFSTAEQAYRDLVQLAPDNPDAYGELGNLYYQQGQWQQAADAYYEAAQRLLNRGERYPAQHLLRVLWNLDSDKARALESMLNDTMPSG